MYRISCIRDICYCDHAQMMRMLLVKKGSKARWTGEGVGGTRYSQDNPLTALQTPLRFRCGKAHRYASSQIPMASSCFPHGLVRRPFEPLQWVWCCSLPFVSARIPVRKGYDPHERSASWVYGTFDEQGERKKRGVVDCYRSYIGAG